MIEYDIYLPLTDPQGEPIPERALQNIKNTLLRAFGGYTELTQGISGAWEMGGVEFHDQICIVRVLKDDEGSFDMWGFKEQIATLLKQDQVLIISRQVKVV